MAIEEKKPPAPKQRGPPDKAEFKVSEKKIALEKIPELEEAGKQQQKGPFAKQPEQAQAPPGPGIPQVSPEAFRPTINMMAARWNQFLEAPTGDEKDRYRWNQQDTDNLLNAMVALDEKYHFMGNWLQYMPELFAVIVVGGILAKLVMGSRWKQAQKQSNPAAPQPAGPQPAAPSNLVDRVKEILTPKPREGQYETIPPDLAQDATRYLNASQQGKAPAAGP